MEAHFASSLCHLTRGIYAVRYRGLNLVEVLVAVCLIAVLAVVSLPMLTRANGEARSTACRANLMMLGQHLDRYQQSHGQLPALMNRDNKSLDVPTIDTLLDLPLQQRSALHCPSDDADCFARTGTSYGWFATWDHQTYRQPESSPWPMTPILADKAPFHTDQQHPYNALFPAETNAQNERDEHAPPFIAMPYATPY